MLTDPNEIIPQIIYQMFSLTTNLIFSGAVVTGAAIYMRKQTHDRRKRLLDEMQTGIVSSIEHDYIIRMPVPPGDEFTHYKFVKHNGSGKPHELVVQTLNPLLTFTKWTRNDYNINDNVSQKVDHEIFKNLAEKFLGKGPQSVDRELYQNLTNNLSDDFTFESEDVIDITRYNVHKEIYLYGSNQNELFNVKGISNFPDAVDKVYICDTETVTGLFGTALSMMGFCKNQWPSSK
jgi:hypothetical protein